MPRDPLATARHYDAEADAYADLWPAGTEQLEALLARLRPGARILDVGCGAGVDLGRLATKGFEPVGLDLSARMLAASRRRRAGLDHVRADARRLPFAADSFEGILAAYSLIHVPKSEWRETLLDFGRVLGPGGLLLSVFQEGTSWEGDVQGVFLNVVTYDEAVLALAESGFTPEWTFARPPQAHEYPFVKRTVVARREAPGISGR